MLYAARGALSERGTYAKTHAGTWHELRESFVNPGLLDGELVSEAQRLQSKRERADYDAWLASDQDARQAIALADTFLAAVRSALAEPESE
jgi:uncharacterized protein (UPF0332 family)